MPTVYDPTTAALAALGDHLKSAFTAGSVPPAWSYLVGAGAYAAADYAGAQANVQVGWGDQTRSIEYPTIVLDAPGGGERAAHSPVVLAQTNTGTPGVDPRAELLVSMASLGVPIEMNVWADSKAQRSAVLRAIDASLYAQGAALALTPASYYGLPVSYFRTGTVQHADTESSTGSDEFRAIVNLTAYLDEVVPLTAARLTDLHLKWVVHGPTEAYLKAGQTLASLVASGSETDVVF